MYAAFMDYGEVLVIGGTGFLGRQVARALVARGSLPRLLVRAGSESRIPDDIRSACRVTPGDATEPESVENAVQGTSAVVNLAGIAREFPAKGITFERVHVKATRDAVAAARRWGVSRFVHVSALGARPGHPNAFLDSKGRAEEIVADSGLRWTVFRPSIVFGPGDRFVDGLVRLLRRIPVAVVPGDGRVRVQPVFAGDVAHAVADALSDPRTEGQSIDMGGPESFSLDEIVDAVAGALGRRVARAHLPLSLLLPLSRTLSRFARFPFSPEEIGLLAADSTCGSGPWRPAAGRPPVSLREYLAGAAGVPEPGTGTAGIESRGSSADAAVMAPREGDPPSRKAA